MPGIAEDLTDQLSKQIVTMNLLRIVSSHGDATITGRVTDYSNTPRSYGTSGVRQVNVAEYVVHITAAVEFMDNSKNEPLYKGEIKGEGIYNFQTQTEANGKAAAEKDIVDQILQHSVQSW